MREDESRVAATGSSRSQHSLKARFVELTPEVPIGAQGHGFEVVRCAHVRCSEVARGSAVPGAQVIGSGFSLLGRITLAIATIRARCDMDEVTGLDRFEPVPDTAWHDVRVAGPK